MRIGSLFSGGGGGDSGFERAGHEIVFGCEIDAKARSVFRKHNPEIPIYQDVKEITRERLIADGTTFPDLIMGGSPCQDLSVAGKRAGLGGARSGLFYEQCRIADDLGAAWVVWENVAGAFSSNRGEDFAEVLGGLTGNRPAVPAKGWRTGGVCVGPKRVAVWRLLDAQNFGVPQRRRRVFVVAGPRTVARRVVEVLFEPESGDRDSPARSQSGPNSATSTEKRLGTSSRGFPIDGVQTLTGKWRDDPFVESYVFENLPTVDVVGTLAPGAHGSGPSSVNGQDAYTGQLVPVNIHDQPVWTGSAQQEGIAAPLLAEGNGRKMRTSDIDGATWVVEEDTEVFAAFDSTWSGHYQLNNTGETSPTLKVGSSTGGEPPAVATSRGARTIVRRLTPLECERLMGWPDGWTAEGITDDNDTVEIATTNRYRICGNGIVANVTEWIGNRLPTVTGSEDDETKTSSSNRSRSAT